METTFRWLRLSGIWKQDTPEEKSSSRWQNMRWLKKTSQENLKKEKTHDTNENTYQREGDKDDHLTQTHRENRRRPLPARRHLWRLCRRLCVPQGVRCRRLRLVTYSRTPDLSAWASSPTCSMRQSGSSSD